MNLFDSLTRLDGRIGRKQFWIGLAVIFGLLIFAIGALMALFGLDVFDGPYSGDSLVGLAFGAVSVVVTVPVMLKRLHDLNRSIRLLIPSFIFEALSITGNLTGLTGTADDLSTAGYALLAVHGIYALALFIFLGFYRGTEGHNDFGADPLAPEEIPASVSL